MTPVPGITLLGTAQALDLIPTIYGEFLTLRDASGVMRSCATDMPLMPHTGPTKNILNYGRVVAFNVADGVDGSQAQTLADANTTATPGEVLVQVLLAGSTMRRAPDTALLTRTGRIMHAAYDLKEDSDGTAQLPSFTPILGSESTVIGIGYLYAGAARLGIGNDRSNPEPAPEPWFCVLHPLQVGIIAARLTPLNAVPAGTTAAAAAAAGDFVSTGYAGGGLQEQILRRGINAIGRLQNALVKWDANIAVASDDGASGAMFSKDGLIYVTEVEPRMDPDDSDKSLRGAIENNLWGSYAWTLYRPANYGVELLFDAALPTS